MKKLFTISTLLITTLIFSLSASLKITSAQEHVISSQALEVEIKSIQQEFQDLVVPNLERNDFKTSVPEINSNSRISLALYQSSSDLYSFAYDIKTEIDGKEVRTTLLPVNQSNAYSDYELMYISVNDVQESMTKQDSLINIRVTSTCDIRYQNDDEVYRFFPFRRPKSASFTVLSTQTGAPPDNVGITYLIAGAVYSYPGFNYIRGGQFDDYYQYSIPVQKSQPGIGLTYSTSKPMAWGENIFLTGPQAQIGFVISFTVGGQSRTYQLIHSAT